jgi:hypothetical protein
VLWCGTLSKNPHRRDCIRCTDDGRSCIRTWFHGRSFLPIDDSYFLLRTDIAVLCHFAGVDVVDIFLDIRV